MKKIILLGLIIVVFLPHLTRAGNFVCYDPNTGRITKTYFSVSNELIGTRIQDCDINIMVDYDTFYSIDLYSKVSDGNIVEMTQQEKDVLDAEIAQRLKNVTITSIDNYDILTPDLVRGLSDINVIDPNSLIRQIKINKGLISR